MNIRHTLLALMVIMAACSSEHPAVPEEPGDRGAASHAAPAPLFYHIFVRSFADSDGDRHGDLRGTIENLDCLESIGVTGIRLTPLYPSAFYQNYFADEFYGIDQEFGSLGDYQNMIEAAYARGMKVVLHQEIQYVFVENHDTDRFASLHESDPVVLKFGAAANLLTGWIPIIHYGQELGMRGEKLEGDLPLSLRSSGDDVRDIPVREAMRWDSAAIDGGRADWYHLFPEAYDQPSANDDETWADTQHTDDSFLLNFYRKIAQFRASQPTQASGSTEVALHQGDVVMVARKAQGKTTYVVFNFSPDQQALTGVPTLGLTTITGSASLEGGELVLSGFGVVLIE